MSAWTPYFVSDIDIAIAAGRRWEPTRVEFREKRADQGERFGLIMAVSDETLSIPLELLFQWDRALVAQKGWVKTPEGQMAFYKQLGVIYESLRFSLSEISDDDYEKVILRHFHEAFNLRRKKLNEGGPKDAKRQHPWAQAGYLVQLRFDLLQLSVARKKGENWSPYNRLRNAVGMDELSCAYGPNPTAAGRKEKSEARIEGFAAGWPLNSPRMKLTDAILKKIAPDVQIKRASNGALILPTSQETRNHGIETDHPRILPAQTDTAFDTGSVDEIRTTSTKRRLRSSKSESNHQHAA
jgi:hypothetical protein